MEFIYCITIGIFGAMIAYKLGMNSVKNENDKILNDMLDNNVIEKNAASKQANHKLTVLQKQLQKLEDKITNTDIVQSAKYRAEDILEDAKEEAQLLISDAEIARQSMLKEIENLKGDLNEKVKSFINGGKPITAQENLDSLLSKTNTKGKYPNFQKR